jgi:hypothetical protein
MASGRDLKNVFMRLAVALSEADFRWADPQNKQAACSGLSWLRYRLDTGLAGFSV